MKKFSFSILFLVPLLLPAQLNHLRPGMSLEETRKYFPAMRSDFVGMTSWVYGDDSINGIPGKATWVITRDTLRSYQFNSHDVLGPCIVPENKDTLNANLLVKKANELGIMYTRMYGKASQGGKEENKQYLFYGRWEGSGDHLTVSVERPILANVREEVNGPNTTWKGHCANCCYYKLVVRAEGKGKLLGEKFGIGSPKNKFKKDHPKQASQVKDFTDNWVMNDSLNTNYGNWKFSFTNGKLSAFTLDVYDGEMYKHKTEEAYEVLLKRAKTLTREGKKSFGKPDNVTTLPDKYPEHDIHLYYSRVDYEAKWMLSDTSVVVRLSETGGGQSGPPVFHLEVLYPVLPK
ncbi:MAG: hypothetical protein HY064_00500 [Bacteroidetes bacterium]|nr:hypothetical protein [Bacteroidota bacterium]